MAGKKQEGAIEKASQGGAVAVVRDPMDAATYRILNRSEEDIDKAMNVFPGLYAFFESKAAWYDKPPPSFVNAIALVRRHLWLTSEGFSRSGVEPDTQKVQPLCTIHS